MLFVGGVKAGSSFNSQKSSVEQILLLAFVMGETRLCKAAAPRPQLEGPGASIQTWRALVCGFTLCLPLCLPGQRRCLKSLDGLMFTCSSRWPSLLPRQIQESSAAQAAGTSQAEAGGCWQGRPLCQKSSPESLGGSGKGQTYIQRRKAVVLKDMRSQRGLQCRAWPELCLRCLVDSAWARSYGRSEGYLGHSAAQVGGAPRRRTPRQKESPQEDPPGRRSPLGQVEP